MSSELMPCPWPSCGSDAVEVEYLDNISVVCRECGANGPVVHPRPAGIVDACQEAARLWNERAGDEVTGIEFSADGMSVTVVKDGYGYEYTLSDFYSEKGGTDEV